MTRLRFYTPQTDVLRHTFPAKQWRDIQPERLSPFRDVSFGSRIRTYAARLCIHIAERFTRCDFFIENTNRELAQFSAAARALLQRFIEQGVVLSWEAGHRAIDKPGIAFCRIDMGAVKTANGETTADAGALQAFGIGMDMDTALVIALAEGIERHAATRWDESVLQKATMQELESRKISYYAHNFSGGSLDKHQIFHWTQAQRFSDRASVLVPACMNHLFFSKLHPNENVFWETSSNACATQRTLAAAIVSALYEAFERDGFLMYWLNNVAPKQIDPVTITDSQICTWLTELNQANISVWICDCTTEYGVPTIVTVLRDEVTGGVDVNASAGFDIDNVLRKAMVDTMRWGLGYVDGRTLDDASVVPMRAHVGTMEARRQLWHGGYMRNEIDAFVSGSRISFDEFSQQFDSPPPRAAHSAHLKWLLSHLRKFGFDGYWTDLTDGVARDAGLHVVRVIAPDLIPMYFNDAQAPLEVERLYTFKQSMGFENRRTERSELNPLPHPFI